MRDGHKIRRALKRKVASVEVGIRVAINLCLLFGVGEVVFEVTKVIRSMSATIAIILCVIIIL